MSVVVQTPKPGRRVFQDHGEAARILFVYDRRSEGRRSLCRAIVDESRWDVAECGIDEAKSAFADHDIVITDRATLITDPTESKRRIYKGDELIRNLKAGGRNPDLLVIIASDMEDPSLEYEGRPPLDASDRYYKENIGVHVQRYFKYPLDPQLVVETLKGLETNRY